MYSIAAENKLQIQVSGYPLSMDLEHVKYVIQAQA